MGQKVNPIAVRLYLNRLSNSSWFSDYYYSTIFHQDLNFQNYFHSIKQPTTNKLGVRIAKSIFHHFPRRSVIHLFCLSDPLKKKLEKKPFIKRISHGIASKEFVNKPYKQGLASKLLLNVVDPQKNKQLSSLSKSDVLSKSNEIDKVRVQNGMNKERYSHLLSNLLSRTDISSFWLKSSAGQKKKAFINLSRGVGSPFTETFHVPNHELEKACSQDFGQLSFSKDFATQKSFFHSLGWVLQINRSHSLLSVVEPSRDSQEHDFFTRSILKKALQEMPASIKTHFCMKRHFFRVSHLTWSLLNLYALHFYFLRKINSSAGPGFRIHSDEENSLNFRNGKEGPFQFSFGSDNMTSDILRGTSFLSQNSILPTSYISKSLSLYLSNIHFVLSQNSKVFISLYPIQVQNINQCAFLIAQEIGCKLEQKKSFRFICRLIFQQLSSLRYIKGIRVVCSGRINGAEIAKSECRKFGETSLHVFSDKIDYAQVKASTPYGILGIKVWVSFL